MATRNGVLNTATPGSLLLVIHDFVARSTDELSLAKGDRIELIERDDDFGDGWFLGRHLGNGGTGLFPEVYMTPAPKGTLNSATQPRRINDGPIKSAASAGTSASDTSTTSPAQQRHLSGSAVQTQSASMASQHPPPAQTALRTSLPATIPSLGARTQTFNADSPVMNETLSVINEHITDMNSPRSSLHNGTKRDTMGSVYSQTLTRMSYIPGHETDEDETLHTEEEVMLWSPLRVAEYLEDHLVEKQHCEVFKDQEISGEVLLAMDQSSLFIKEFDLGSVGRRLKTWHRIKALQDEVRRSSPDPSKSVASDDHSTSAGATPDDASIVSEPNRNRSSTFGTPSFSPRGLEPGRQSMDAGRSNTLQASSSMSFIPPQSSTSPNLTRAASSAMSPLQSMTSLSRPENTYRPSAQTIRQMQNARRHSSIDSTSSAGATRNTGHRKQPSIDKKWQPGQPMSQLVNGKSAHSHTMSAESPAADQHTASAELDRGYISDNQATSQPRKSNLLTKKTTSVSAAVSPMQSRTNSGMFSNNRSGGQTSSMSTSPRKDAVGPLVSAGASSHMANAMNAVQTKFGGVRSATSPPLGNEPPTTPMQPPMSPTVTKLEYTNGTSTTLNALAASSAGTSDASGNVTPRPSSTQLGFFASQRQRIPGFRSSSEAVTKPERNSADVRPTAAGEVKALASPTRTGSTTPSTETRSFDMQKSLDGQSRRTSTASGGKSVQPQQQGLVPPPTSTKRARPKTKKATSAYTKGLEKITPAEQLKRGCDYSGWMKKKSGSLMSTWKPRLFIVKGRRLSYYYSETDTEEKGLIDISFHRVLPAHNETLTGLHASLTGAAGASPTSPTHTTATQAEQDLKNSPPKPGDKSGDNAAGLFIFKLIPPRSGLAKGVSFTKPTVHYFAVNSRQEGRLWMAALMKATIDRDDDGVVTTTYSQKTISLEKARARRERPPALKEEGAEGRAELEGVDGGEREGGGEGRGLGIGGLGGGEAGAGAEMVTPAVVGGAVAEDEVQAVSEKEEPVTKDSGVALLGPDVMPATVAERRVSDEKEVAPGAS
ncbi:polar growth protein [Friedmanniomyces endolithicus]|uniref:Polar growth protein n=1 Tax=Friedmanniomyces endolithicus TaxID=329885 RepID=A0AAN6H4J5_9PEZI|nr:polar growth protein [Friedmanniomyces endolithicus]KAK0955049.1 polar growth protein [Friedmanniomyces endolithicus]KAK0958883.1 polar growth protein [Friedmanniomyces endolithicus]KAK1041676.1 polar growth protein [Friedmanniomyces endolithicus]